MKFYRFLLSQPQRGGRYSGRGPSNSPSEGRSPSTSAAPHLIFCRASRCSAQRAKSSPDCPSIEIDRPYAWGLKMTRPAPFSLGARRLIFQEARQRGFWAVTAGPVGFRAAWLLFDPHGTDFDTYFGLHDGMTPLDQLAAFAIGLTPAGTHWAYFGASKVKVKSARSPSVGLSCQLCSGIAAIEMAKVILGRKPLRAAPCSAQLAGPARSVRP